MWNLPGFSGTPNPLDLSTFPPVGSHKPVEGNLPHGRCFLRQGQLCGPLGILPRAGRYHILSARPVLLLFTGKQLPSCAHPLQQCVITGHSWAARFCVVVRGNQQPRSREFNSHRVYKGQLSNFASIV